MSAGAEPPNMVAATIRKLSRGTALAQMSSIKHSSALAVLKPHTCSGITQSVLSIIGTYLHLHAGGQLSAGCLAQLSKVAQKMRRSVFAHVQGASCRAILLRSSPSGAVLVLQSITYRRYGHWNACGRRNRAVQKCEEIPRCSNGQSLLPHTWE